MGNASSSSTTTTSAKRQAERRAREERKREFAAEVGVQAHALRMAAEGAIAAYEHVVGESWKPFERQPEHPGETVSRKAAEVQMAAFE